MNPEQHEAQPPHLTPEQEEIADMVIELFDLQDQADTQLEMAGHSGTLRYGIGFCARHFGITDPNQQITEDQLNNLHTMVIAKLEQQKEN